MSRIRGKGIILGLFVVGSACLLAIPVSSEETRPAPPLDRDRIEKRVQEIQPTAKERRGEASSLPSGLVGVMRRISLSRMRIRTGTSMW
jgi:hypothetical protein